MNIAKIIQERIGIIFVSRLVYMNYVIKMRVFYVTLFLDLKTSPVQEKGWR